MVLNIGLLVISTVLCYSGFTFAACPPSEYTDPQGTIRSPGFNTNDGKYDPNATCTYNIHVSAGQRITLEFKNMSILGTMPNCMEDSVEIFVGCKNTTIGKFCSCSNVSMPVIYSYDNCMTLVFKSDGKNQGKGFEAQYTTADNTVRLDPKNCSTDSVTPLHGALYSPNWPLKYPAMASCVWTFNPPPATIVRFFFTSFELDGDPICDPTRPPQTGDHISISGTNTSGVQVIIKKRICTMPADAFFPIKNMKAIEVRFGSNSVRTNDGTGVMAGYATYIEGDLDSSSSSCTVGPPTTTSPVSTGTSSRGTSSTGTSSTGTTGAKGSTTSSGGTSSGLSDTSPTGTKGSTSTGISRSAGTSSGLSVGEKAGIGVGVVLGVILLIAAGYLIWKNFFKKTTSTPEEKVFMETQP